MNQILHEVTLLLLKKGPVIALGALFTWLLTLAIAIMVAYLLSGDLLFSPLGMFAGLLQLLYIVPICQSAWDAGFFAFSAGVAGGALIVLSTNVIALMALLGPF